MSYGCSGGIPSQAVIRNVEYNQFLGSHGEFLHTTQLTDTRTTFELLSRGSGRYSLKAGSFYICAANKGNVTCNRQSANDWENFSLIPVDGYYQIVAQRDDKPIYATGQSDQVRHNRSSVGREGLWEIIDGGSGGIPSQAVIRNVEYNQFLGSHGEFSHTTRLTDTRTTFELLSCESGRYSLKAGSFYICAANEGNVTCNRKSANDWESFSLIPTDGYYQIVAQRDGKPIYATGESDQVRHNLSVVVGREGLWDIIDAADVDIPVQVGGIRPGSPEYQFWDRLIRDLIAIGVLTQDVLTRFLQQAQTSPERANWNYIFGYSYLDCVQYVFTWIEGNWEGLGMERIRELFRLMSEVIRLREEELNRHGGGDAGHRAAYQAWRATSDTLHTHGNSYIQRLMRDIQREIARLGGAFTRELQRRWDDIVQRVRNLSSLSFWAALVSIGMILVDAAILLAELVVLSPK